MTELVLSGEVERNYRLLREEGFAAVAKKYELIAAIEKEHEERYRALLARVEAETVFKREAAIKWKCGNCGYVHEGPEPPEVCPACAHPKGYFAQKEDNY